MAMKTWSAVVLVGVLASSMSACGATPVPPPAAGADDVVKELETSAVECLPSDAECGELDSDRFYLAQYERTDYVCEIADYGAVDECELESSFQGLIVAADLWCRGPDGECTEFDPEEFYAMHYKGIEYVCESSIEAVDQCSTASDFSGTLVRSELWCSGPTGGCTDLDPSMFYEVSFESDRYVCERDFGDFDECSRVLGISGRVVAPDLWCRGPDEACTEFDPSHFYELRYDYVDYVCEIDSSGVDGCEKASTFIVTVNFPDIWCSRVDDACYGYDPREFFASTIGGQRVLCKEDLLGGSVCVNWSYGLPAPDFFLPDWRCDRYGSCESAW